IGSNLPHPEFGSPQAVCEAALQRLEEQGIRIVRRSHWYRSAPVPLSDQPWFINGVAEVDPGPDLTPADLLNRLHEVEASFGRTRSRRNEDRKSTRLNSSHVKISYAVFCLKKKISAGIGRRADKKTEGRDGNSTEVRSTGR